MFPHFGKEIVKTFLIFISLLDRTDTFKLEDIVIFIRSGELWEILIERLAKDVIIEAVCFLLEEVYTALNS